MRLPRPKTRSHAGSAYLRLEYRQAMEIAIVGAAALVVLDQSGRCREARVALTAVAPTCIRAPDGEALLRGTALDDETLERVAESAATAALPIDDVRAGADYRRAMVRVIVRRALVKAADRARERSGK